jgi:hypothetical protein
MPISVGTKNAMLDSRTLNRIRLHSGAPGASGTDNTVRCGIVNAAVFDAAASGSRALNIGSRGDGAIRKPKRYVFQRVGLDGAKL